MCKAEVTSILNSRARDYFSGLSANEQDKFILQRVKRSKAFKEFISPKVQQGQLFRISECGEYEYFRDCVDSHNGISDKKAVKRPSLSYVSALLHRADSQFKANCLHFSTYGLMYQYKKKIQKSRQELAELKSHKLKGLNNIKEALNRAKLIKEKEQVISSLCQKLINHYQQASA